jgi:ABC-2 type transport system ATP-binding protein
VEHVRKDFGAVQAVRDVTFTIASGSTFGLLGPNGAGKTTTMRMIVGIYPVDGGTIAWNGAHITDRSRRRFGYMPEERGLYGKMRVREQITYFGRLHGLHDPEIGRRADAWIEQLGLADYAQRPCGELSKGNQQKVQVACAAVHEPELLILDEPFSGLDPVNADVLLKTLTDLKKRGTTLVLSSHQMWQLEQICDAFCIITSGENRASGTLQELRAAWPTRVVKVEPATAALRSVLDRVPHAKALESNGALYYEVPATTTYPALLRELVEADAVTRFDALEPSLEEIYLHAITNAAPTGNK